MLQTFLAAWRKQRRKYGLASAGFQHASEPLRQDLDRVSVYSVNRSCHKLTEEHFSARRYFFGQALFRRPHNKTAIA